MSPLRIHFPLFTPTELYHYRVTYIVLLLTVTFLSSFLCIPSMLAYYWPLTVGKPLNKGAELNYCSPKF